ncbi:MAG: DNA alkylation repair protein [bacterium]|nr:DNA alkylation repair protein [bacterium]MDE0234943.1 DNA alkylation repair protein [bacterium]
MSTTIVASALCDETLARLEELGTPQNRKVYPRHGVDGPLFGVSYANLRKLAKRLAPDPRLAADLWSSGNHDARVLATMVDDPSRTTERTLRERLADVDNYVLADALASLVGRSALRDDLAEDWTTKPEDEWTGTVGWSLVAAQALDSESALSDEYFTERLSYIERTIAVAANRVRHSMNGALIAIGCRSQEMRQAAEEAAGRIGKVKVDHGQTSCKTPDALPYLARVWSRKTKGRSS